MPGTVLYSIGLIVDLVRNLAIVYLVLKATAWAYVNTPPLNVLWG